MGHLISKFKENFEYILVGLDLIYWQKTKTFAIIILEDKRMKFLKKLTQVGLAVFFFGLLATSVVLADDADSEGWQFVQENGRTYYKKGELK